MTAQHTPDVMEQRWLTAEARSQRQGEFLEARIKDLQRYRAINAELLAALEAAYAELDGIGHEEVGAQARAAIAKAKGGK